MRLHVHHTGLTDLASDLAALPPRVARDSIATVRDNAKAGALLARANAKATSGAHGKHHHKAYSSEMAGAVGFGGVFGYAAEYGPDASKLQGDMSFEEGSRNQRPHRPLGKTRPIIRKAFHREFSRKIDGWFW